MPGAFFIVNNLLAVLVAWQGMSLILRNREPWRRALAVVAGYPVVVAVTMFLLHGFSAIRPAPITAALVSMSVALAVASRIRARHYDSPADLAHPSAPEPSVAADTAGVTTERVLTVIALTALAYVAVSLLMWFAMGATIFKWDDLAYHASAPMHWMIDGRLSLEPSNQFHQYLCLNSELMALWLMLPFGRDGMAGLTSLVWYAVMGTSMYGALRAMGFRAHVAMVPVALLLVSNPVFTWAKTFTGVDLAGPAFILAAAAMAMPGKAKSDDTRWDCVVYAGLFAGFAVGSKLFNASTTAIIAIWLIVQGRGALRLPGMLGRGLVFTIAALVAGGFWPLRVWALTGNPAFPFGLGPFDGPFPKTEMMSTTLAHFVANTPHSNELWWTIIKAMLDWPISLGVASLAGYLGTIALTAGRRFPTGTEKLPGRSLLLIAGTVLIIQFPNLPFSGGFASPSEADRQVLRIGARYVLVVFPIGLVLFSSLIGWRHAASRLLLIASAIAVVTMTPVYWFGWHVPAFATALIGGGAALTYTPLCTRRRAQLNPWIARTAVAACLLIGLMWLVHHEPQRQRATDKRLLGFFGLGEQQGPAWEAIDRLPDGARITWFHHEPDINYYALFGRRGQHHPVPTTLDGLAVERTHVAWLTGVQRRSWYEQDPLTETALREHLLSNLEKLRVEYVLTTKFTFSGDGDWPAQHRVIAGSGRAESVFQDDYSAIWRLLPPPPPRDP